MSMGARIRTARTEANLSQTDLGRQLGVSREAVSLWESDRNAPTADKIGVIAMLTGRSAEWLMTAKEAGKTAVKVPVVAYVGAGAEVHSFGDQVTLDRVEPPPGVVDCVAGRIRGDSMHPLRDGWLIFWRKRQEGVPDECLGAVCIVQVTNGPTLIKELRRGTRKGRYTLQSWNAPAREDVTLDWASKILDIRPS